MISKWRQSKPFTHSNDCGMVQWKLRECLKAILSYLKRIRGTATNRPTQCSHHSCSAHTHDIVYSILFTGTLPKLYNTTHAKIQEQLLHFFVIKEWNTFTNTSMDSSNLCIMNTLSQENTCEPSTKMSFVGSNENLRNLPHTLFITTRVGSVPKTTFLNFTATDIKSKSISNAACSTVLVSGCNIPEWRYNGKPVPWMASETSWSDRFLAACNIGCSCYYCNIHSVSPERI